MTGDVVHPFPLKSGRHTPRPPTNALGAVALVLVVVRSSGIRSSGSSFPNDGVPQGRTSRSAFARCARQAANRGASE
jgi:hypothetical protein